MLRYIDIVTIMSFIAMAIVAVQTIRHYRAKIPKPPPVPDVPTARALGPKPPFWRGRGNPERQMVCASVEDPTCTDVVVRCAAYDRCPKRIRRARAAAKRGDRDGRPGQGSVV